MLGIDAAVGSGQFAQFGGGDLRMGVCVVCLDTKPVEVFHHVDLQSPVGGVAKVARSVERLLSDGSHTIFNRVLNILIEHACHNLLALSGEILVAQVEVVSHGML